jgi:hypothetical protein
LYFLVAIAFGQDTDSAFVQSTSESILSRKINFSHPNASLDSVLIQLSSEQQIKISYSYDKTKGITVPANSYSSQPISSILSSSLSNTGLNYMIVGKIVVIFPEEKKKTPVEPPKDSSKVQSNTTISITNSSTTTSNSSTKNHIYHPNANLDKLPLSERRKIRKLYEEELKWSIKFRKFGNKKDEDTSNTDEDDKELKRPVYKIVKRDKDYYPFFISGKLGLINYHPKIVERSTVSWESQLNFSSTSSTLKVHPTLSFGYMNRFMKIEVGVTSQRFSYSGKGRQIFPKGKSGKADTVVVNFSDTYSITTLPLELVIFKRWNKLYTGIGAGVQIGFIKAIQATPNKLKDYLAKLDETASYYEFMNKFTWANSVKIEAGYWLNPKFAIGLDVQYLMYWKPFTENYFYDLYPNSLMANVSLMYFFRKPSSKTQKF